MFSKTSVFSSVAGAVRMVPVEQAQYWGLLPYGLQCHYSVLYPQGE